MTFAAILLPALLLMSDAAAGSDRSTAAGSGQVWPENAPREMQAPGCIKSAGLTIGGCFGKTLIKDLQIAPEIPCLRISVNNCNGGVLEIGNNCEEDLRLADLLLPYVRASRVESEVKVKLFMDEEGAVRVKAWEWLERDAWDALPRERYGSIAALGRVGDAQFEITLERSEASSEVDVRPPVECLTFSLGEVRWTPDVLFIENRCAEEVTLGGVTVEPYVKTVEEPGALYTVELKKDETGSIVARVTQGNYASYVPVEDEELAAPAEIGGREFLLSYLMTKKLCD